MDCRPPTVRRIVIFNDSQNLLTTLKVWFETHGHHARTVRLSDFPDPMTKIGAVIHEFDADVAVFDIGIPLMSSWDVLCVLRVSPPLDTFPFVVTTPNIAALDQAAAMKTGAFELTGTAENLDALLALIDETTAPPRPYENPMIFSN